MVEDAVFVILAVDGDIVAGGALGLGGGIATWRSNGGGWAGEGGGG